MTTQSTLTQRGIDRYAHIEPLPDPPEEERDMEQFDGIEELRFRDPASGEFLLTPEESREAMLAAEAQAESERAARAATEARLAEMEAELRRLRAEQ